MNCTIYDRIDDIIVGSRAEAREILDKLYEIADTYGVVSVGDLYDICDLSSACTDYKKYWYGITIKGAYMERVKEGYRIRTPRYVDENNHSYKRYPAESLNITIHTNDVDDPDETLADVFKYIHTIKDRTVNVTIM